LRSVAAIALVLPVAALAGCGGGSASPESVVRAWSHALNEGDNDGAAELFAKNAEVIQGGRIRLLRSHAEAVGFNASLPCSGRIVEIKTDGSFATATFVLGDRPTSPCDAPGQRARAEFQVRNGQIVLWRQLATRPSTAPPQTASV
jgi:limonene-1,2-epoxide hydrolase